MSSQRVRLITEVQTASVRQNTGEDSAESYRWSQSLIFLDRGVISPLFRFAFALLIDISKDAGWSSLVARQAHNLKVAGSNPAPATNPSPMAAIYRVYVLQNPERRFYIGITDDVPRRIGQHNAGESRWTKGRNPWKLAWQSKELSRSDARKLENRLKRQAAVGGFIR